MSVSHFLCTTKLTQNEHEKWFGLLFVGVAAIPNADSILVFFGRKAAAAS